MLISIPAFGRSVEAYELRGLHGRESRQDRLHRERDALSGGLKRAPTSLTPSVAPGKIVSL